MLTSLTVAERTKTTQVLVIDDDLELLTLLDEWLTLEGFAALTAASGEVGLRLARAARPDLILLDILTPGMDGWVVYRRLRRVSAAPIIVLTTLSSARDIAIGLSLGVDGYLTKPYSLADLRARMGEVLAGGAAGEREGRRALFDDGHLRVDWAEGASVQGEDAVDLTPTQSRLLCYLASRRGRTVPHDELLVSVWGPEYAGEARYLDVYVRHLRHKIERDPAHPRYIRAEHGEGYRFVGDDDPHSPAHHPERRQVARVSRIS